METYMKELLEDARDLLFMHQDGSRLHKQLSNLLNRRSPKGDAPFSLKEKHRRMQQGSQ